jgi:hypothetical protein
MIDTKALRCAPGRHLALGMPGLSANAAVGPLVFDAIHTPTSDAMLTRSSAATPRYRRW